MPLKRTQSTRKYHKQLLEDARDFTMIKVNVKKLLKFCKKNAVNLYTRATVFDLAPSATVYIFAHNFEYNDARKNLIKLKGKTPRRNLELFNKPRIAK